MTYTYVPGRVNGTGVEVTEALDGSDDEHVMVELHGLSAPTLDRAGATALRDALHLALARGDVKAISRCDKPIKARCDRGDYVRAGGDTICEGCGFEYREHPEARGFPTLHILCDGRLVKL